MTRGKQKKKSIPFGNNLSREDVRGRGRGGKLGGKAYGEDEIRESKLACGLVTSGGRGKKRGESFQLKYSKRYDELVYTETVHSQKSEISKSMSLRPLTAKRKSTKIQGTGPHNDVSHELEGVHVQPSGGKKSGARKNHKIRKAGSQSYNTTLYIYDGEARQQTTPAHKVRSSDMDATPEVVLPANENWAEVIVDRRGNAGNPVGSPSPIGGHTWGLGYVNEEISEKNTEEMFKKTADAEEIDGHDPQAGLDINPAQMGDGLGGELDQPLGTRKGRYKSVTRESGHLRRTKTGADESRRGFLSIGGLKIYTQDVSGSSDEDSCTEQMDEGFADEDDGYMDFSRKYQRGKNRIKDRSGRQKHLSSPDPARFSASMLESSDGEDSYESSDSDISNELVEDYLANCEGLSADIDDPSWVSRIQKSLEYPHIDEMDIPDEESDSSGEEELDPESHYIVGSGSELEDDLKHRYRIRQDLRRRRSDDTTVQGDSEVETEDLEQKVLFGYDSDTSSGTGEDKEDALLSDDEVRIRDLELDDQARIRDLELEDSTVGHASVKTETIGELVFGSANTEGIGALDSTSVNTEANGGLISFSAEDVLLTSSVGTQTLPASTDVARTRQPGLQDKKLPSFRSNMLPKYRSVGEFISGLGEEVSLATPLANQTWPVTTGKTVKKSKGVPGQKRTERQETIKEKRRERAVKRGFDIAAVNKDLEEMVRLKKDIIAFEPMEQRDRGQVHKLARIYKLKSGSQGATKRRFVVVSVTENTSMPSAEDKVLLLKLLARNNPHTVENTPTSSRTLTGEERRRLAKQKRAARQALQGSEIPLRKKGRKYRYFSQSVMRTPGTNTEGRSAEKSRGRNGNPIPSGQGSHKKRDKKAVVYANNPVSFIGKGMESEEASITPASTGRSNPASTIEGMTRRWLPKVHAGSSGAAGCKSISSDFAVFEAHTNGFASRMMAKMGYVEGHGLGRDKQGIAQPLEAVIRPKSLGLGCRA